MDKIANVVKKVRLKNSGSDFAFWQSQPYEERLRALELIRKEYNTWKYGFEQKFQRVYRIIKKK